MTIRRATLSDVPALVSLNRASQDMHADAFPGRFRRDAPTDVVASAFTAMMDSPAAYWLVAEEARPIGFLNAEFRERAESWCMAAHRVCYLGGIVVDPAFRKQGVAHTLFAELKREADARNVTGIELDVWSFNDAARQVFMKWGFRPMMERMALSRDTPSARDTDRHTT